MDVRLSPDQVALRDSAARLVEDLAAKSVAQLDDPERVTKLDATVDAAGWRELRVAHSGDEPLATSVDVAIIAEELGYGLADTRFLGPSLAADLRRRAGASPGPPTETVALAADLSTLGFAPTPSNTLTAVDAGGSTAALLLTEAGESYGLQTAPLSVPAVVTDLTRPAARVLTADATEVADCDRLLSEADLAGWSAFALAMICADLVGTMRGAIRLACDYATIRHQFGVPVGSFQAVQHLLADAFVSMEGSRSVALHAAWAADALPPAEALVAARVAKAYCGRAARDVCETAIQVHGGIGNTWECLGHVFLRRALLSIELLGGVGVSLNAVLASRGIEAVAV